MASVASSVKSHKIIAYFFFPWVFGITCSLGRDFAENCEIWARLQSMALFAEISGAESLGGIGAGA